MAQDQSSGAAANHYGRDYAKRVANAPGGQMVRKGSNECVLNTARISIHCANVGNNRVGVTYDTLKRVSAVFGAFAVGGGYYNVLSLPVSDYSANMTPTKSTGPSSGKVGIVGRKVFEALGAPVAQIQI
jgi:hypothetical protein